MQCVEYFILFTDDDFPAKHEDNGRHLHHSHESLS